MRSNRTWTALKTLLKRGALVAAANWQVVVVQFVAESAYKALLMVPVAGAALLLGLSVGVSAAELLERDLRQSLGMMLEALRGQPGALTAYLFGVAVLVVGGSVLVFLVKGGTVHVLVEAERRAGPLERPPLRLTAVRAASVFGLERFTVACRTLGRRFIALGLLLMALYAVTGMTYLAILYVTVPRVEEGGSAVAWPLLAAGTAVTLVTWITVVNLLYLLAQMVMAARDVGPGAAIAEVGRLLKAERHMLGAVFVAVLALAVLATAASLLATAAVGFIGFVPVVGIAVLPLQVAAWLLRGLLFQYLGLTALGAYARIYRAGGEPAVQARPGARAVPSMGRIA